MGTPVSLLTASTARGTDRSAKVKVGAGSAAIAMSAVGPRCHHDGEKFNTNSQKTRRRLRFGARRQTTVSIHFGMLQG
jgi:hypothetical protein